MMGKEMLLDLIETVVLGRRRRNPVLVVLSVIGCIAAVALIAYGIYRFLTPDYFDDYDDDDDFDDDDFDDDFEDDFEEEEAAAAEA